MPAAIPAVIAAISAAAAAETLAAAALIFAKTFAVSLVLGLVASKLAPSPGDSAFKATASRQSLSFREPVTSHKIVYGQNRVGGPIVFVASTSKNLYLHLLVAVAAHEIESMDEVWLDDNVISSDMLDANGVVTSGPYKNNVRIRRHLGAPDQEADPLLVAEVNEWTTQHRAQEIAYIYVRLKYNQDVFPGGIPNISTVIKGRRVYDPRIGGTAFTSNIALLWYDYMRSPVFGPGADETEFDEANIIAQANICDEMVTTAALYQTITMVAPASDLLTMQDTRLAFQLGDQVQLEVASGAAPGGLSTGVDYFIIPYQYKEVPRVRLATSLANAMAGVYVNITSAGSGFLTLRRDKEPRYHGSGILDTDAVIQANIEDILTGASARAVYAGGKWRLLVAAWRAPIATLGEGDFVGSIQLQTKRSRRDRFNAVKGTYVSSINDFQPTDYPQQLVQAFLDEDASLPLIAEQDFPFTNRVTTAQRLAKVKLLRSRQEIAFTVPVSLAGFRAQAGETVAINSTRLGWTEKPFEVVSFNITSDGGDNPRIYIDMELVETAEAAFDWLSSDAMLVDPAPNTNLPNAFLVDVPTGVSFDSRATQTQAGDTVYNLSLEWDAHPDAFVQQDGAFEIQFKRSDEVDWRPSFVVPGELTRTDLLQSAPNIPYDLRIRAKNNIGVRSAWVTLIGAVAGSSGGITVTNDWGNFTTTGGTLDWGSFTGPIGSYDDWGYFT